MQNAIGRNRALSLQTLSRLTLASAVYTRCAPCAASEACTRSVRKGPQAPLSRSLSAAATGNSQECASEIKGRSRALSALARPKGGCCRRAAPQSEKDEASRAEVARVEYWNALPEAIAVRCPPPPSLLLSFFWPRAPYFIVSSVAARARFLCFLLAARSPYSTEKLPLTRAPARAYCARGRFPRAGEGILEIILRLRHEPNIPRAPREYAFKGCLRAKRLSLRCLYTGVRE